VRYAGAWAERAERVGAHSESMFIFRWDGSTYRCVGELLSDAPSIEIKDIDGDGLAEVLVKGLHRRSDYPIRFQRVPLD